MATAQRSCERMLSEQQPIGAAASDGTSATHAGAESLAVRAGIVGTDWVFNPEQPEVSQGFPSVQCPCLYSHSQRARAHLGPIGMCDSMVPWRMENDNS